MITAILIRAIFTLVAMLAMWRVIDRLPRPALFFLATIPPRAAVLLGHMNGRLRMEISCAGWELNRVWGRWSGFRRFKLQRPKGAVTAVPQHPQQEAA